MEQEREIYSLLAETRAIQFLLVNVLRRLANSDPNLLKAIAAGFDDVASKLRSSQFKLVPKPIPGALTLASVSKLFV